MFVKITGIKCPLLRIVAGVWLLVSCTSPQGSVEMKKMLSGAADQIHYSVINGTSVTFDWTGTAGIIAYGRKPGKLNRYCKAIHSGFLPVAQPWLSDSGQYWEARITGLAQNTVYYYRIGDTNGISHFKTPPLPGKGGFRIITTTDMHEASPESKAMFKQIAELKPDVVLTTGDITGAGPDGQKNVGERFRDAMVWSQSAAWIPAWGNHDWEYDTIDDLRTYKGRFDIPNPGTIKDSPQISCCGEDWGWFDYGNTRFISLPEPWTPSVRNEWVNQVTGIFTEAENNSAIRFIVTYGHRSAWTSTYRRSPGEKDLREILNRFHTAFPKYVLDLSGHNHQYERYRLPDGMTFIVNSSTGSYYHEGWETPYIPQYCQFRAIHYGILVLDFSEDQVHGRFLCSVGSSNQGNDYKPLEEKVCSGPGEIIDSFTIESKNSKNR